MSPHDHAYCAGYWAAWAWHRYGEACVCVPPPEEQTPAWRRGWDAGSKHGTPPPAKPVDEKG